jgi:integrase
MLNGDRWQGHEKRLFIQENGKPINPDTINYWLDKFINKHGLEHFTPHSLRHTFASLQIMAGVDIRTLQARTGHAQASTLTNIYAHSIKTAEEAAAETLDNILMPKTAKKGEEIYAGS